MRAPLLLVAIAALLAASGCRSDGGVTARASDPGDGGRGGAGGVVDVLGDGRSAVADRPDFDDFDVFDDGAGEADPPTAVDEPVDGGPLPATVAVVGDSLSVSAESEIGAVLAGLGIEVVAFDAVEGRRMVGGSRGLPPGIDAVDEIVATVDPEPELWVIALGTNDVGAGLDRASLRADIAGLLASIPPGAPLIWIDVWIRDRADEVADANQMLRAALAGRPRTHVVDWFARGDDDGVVAGDGIHLTEVGRLHFAQELREGVVELFSR